MYGISILDADITVDITEPLEAVVAIKSLSLSAVAPRIEEKGEGKEGTCSYFALQLPKNPPIGTREDEGGSGSSGVGGHPLIIKVQSEEGDPDLYISNSANVRRPNQQNHTWMTQGANRTEQIQIQPSDPRLLSALEDDATLYICMYIFKAGSDGLCHWTLSCYYGKKSYYIRYCITIIL